MRSAPALLFGKLPAHGDFVARGLRPGERDAFDAWLSSELAAARVATGDGFEAAYDAAPLWHYAGQAGAEQTRAVQASAGLASTGLAGAGWRGLTVAASVDAAGRRFPLLFGWDDLEPDDARPAAIVAGEILFDAICGGWDADRLAAARPPERPATAARASSSGWWTSNEAVAFTDMHPTGLLTAMLTAAAPTVTAPA